MKSRYLMIAILVGAFLLVLLGAFILQAPEAHAVNYEAPEPSTINLTTNYSTYLPLVLQTPVLFFDDFGNPNSGWSTGEGNNISLSYQNGEYEIKISKTIWWGGSAPSLGNISNYSVETEARLHAGSQGVYGLVFDRQDWENFYVFAVIPSNPSYAVLRHEPNDNWIEVVPQTLSAAVNAGSALNKLKVEREGDKITVYVNDQLLTTATDNTFAGTSNEVGLFAQTLNVQPIQARFDYFVAEQIPGTTSTALSPDAAPSTERTGQGVGGIGIAR